MSTVKAIGLLSGGLDSTLAVRVIRDQGINVYAVNFHTGFCFADTRRADRRKRKDLSSDDPIHVAGGPNDAKNALFDTDIPLEVIDISDGYLEMLHHPQYGYGKNVNPCIDCRIYMFRIAKWLMVEHSADFVFTGEVMAQRPMSQHLRQLTLIAKRSGLESRLLRPLSALLLQETMPEREGWVGRRKLYGFSGRSRKPQMALAEELGIENYPQPAGGCCFLTDPAYGRKVHDLWKHSNKDELDWDDYLLLKTGRHLRVDPNLKVIVARDEGESLFLNQYAPDRIRLEPDQIPGPVVVISHPATDDQLLTAARITASYCSSRYRIDDVSIRIENGNYTRNIIVKPLKREEIDNWLII